MIAAILVVFFAGTIWSGEARNVLSKLYGGVAIIIIIFLMIEYVILKGRDRTRIYKLEVENILKKRQKDIAFLRELERELEDLESCLDSSCGGKCDETRDRVRSLRRRINENL